MPSVKVKINNLTDLEKFAKSLLPYLQPNTYLILQGELGTGKTTLTQLIAKNLGIKEKVTSPTFNILQRYKIKNNYYLNHFDFFRLNDTDNLEIFKELTTGNLNVIEWPEKNPQFWQKEKYIHLKIIKQSSEIRLITVSFIQDILSIHRTNLLYY